FGSMNFPTDTWAAAAWRLWNAAVTYRRAGGTSAPPCDRSVRTIPRCCIDAPTQRLVTIQDLTLVRVLFYAALRHVPGHEDPAFHPRLHRRRPALAGRQLRIRAGG